MNFRRLATFVLGIWLGASTFMDFVAVQNFRSVDRLLGDNVDLRATDQIHKLGGREDARVFLRHFVGEQNRWFFVQWESIQIGLGLALALVILYGTSSNKLSLGICIAMLLIVLIDRLILTPEISRLGRSLDFLPYSSASPDHGKFFALHGVYSGLELLKLALGLILTAKLLIRRKRDTKHFARKGNGVPENAPA